jgi:hypothetical protein
VWAFTPSRSAAVDTTEAQCFKTHGKTWRALAAVTVGCTTCDGDEAETRVDDPVRGAQYASLSAHYC